MKKIIILFVSVLISVSTDAQVGKFLKNVSNAVKDDLLGSSKSSKPAPEPPCACDPADLVFEAGKYKIDYSELNISLLDDGRILLQDRMTANYYIARNGVTEGPFKPGDPKIRQFEMLMQGDDYGVPVNERYKDYISRQGDKFTINFGGKTYGPYGRIDKFALSSERDKFAAIVVENIVVTQDEGDAMEEAIKKAKTEQEKMDLAMKFAQQMQDKIISGGGQTSMLPKVVSNIPVEDAGDYTLAANVLSSKMKYNEILLAGQSGIKDLQGNVIMKLSMGTYNPEKIYISSDNSRYASYDYGILTISDGRKLTELFNPYLEKADGRIYLSYMYFSPKRNAVMKCRIPF